MISPRQETLIDENGNFRYGKYSTSLREVSPLDLKAGVLGHLPRGLKDYRLKEWQAFMIGGKRFYLVIGTMNLKLFSVIRLMVYDKDKNRTWGFSEVYPLRKIKVAESIENDTMFFRNKDVLIYANHFLRTNMLEVGFSFTDELSGEKLSAYFSSASPINEPQVSVLPFQKGAGLYTHKQLMALEGYLKIHNQLFQIDKEETSMVLDDQKTYYPYHSGWDWVTASGIIKDDYCGFTVSDIRGIKGSFNENCFWKNGKIHEVPSVKFCRNKASGTWTIVDEKGMVNILFRPVAKNRIHRNFGVAAGTYEGPFGWFSGHLSSYDGQTLRINGMFGMGEKMNLRL